MGSGPSPKTVHRLYLTDSVEKLAASFGGGSVEFGSCVSTRNVSVALRMGGPLFSRIRMTKLRRSPSGNSCLAISPSVRNASARALLDWGIRRLRYRGNCPPCPSHRKNSGAFEDLAQLPLSRPNLGCFPRFPLGLLRLLAHRIGLLREALPIGGDLQPRSLITLELGFLSLQPAFLCLWRY